MYKILMLFKNSVDDSLLNTFRENALVHLENAIERKITIGNIDGAKLNEEPYEKVCEVNFNSKHEMDEALASVEGKKFNRSMTSFVQHVSIFFIDYGEK